jgi:hypothetical protein
MERIKYLRLADGYVVGHTEAEGRDLLFVKDAQSGVVTTVLAEDVCATKSEVISKLVVIEGAKPTIRWDTPRSDESYEHGGRLYIDLAGEHLEAHTELIGAAAILDLMNQVSECCNQMGEYLLNEHPDNPNRPDYGITRSFAEALERLTPRKESLDDLA